MPTHSKEPVPDRDNPEWTASDWKQAVRLSALPETLQQKLKQHIRGPQKSPTKVAISIRLSRDVVDELRESGPGWQSRVDDALRLWLKKQGKSVQRA